jgi:hypothetical protein
MLSNTIAIVVILVYFILIAVILIMPRGDPLWDRVLIAVEFALALMVVGTFAWFVEERKAPKVKLGALNEVPYRGDWIEPFYVSYDGDDGKLTEQEIEELKKDGPCEGNPGKYSEECVCMALKGVPGWPGSRDGGHKGYAVWRKRYGAGSPPNLQGDIPEEDKKKGWLTRGQTRVVDMVFTPTWIGWCKPEVQDAIYRHARARGKTAIPVYVAQSPMPRWGIVPPTASQQDVKLRDANRELAEKEEDLAQARAALREMTDMLARLKPKEITEEYQ